MKDERIENGSPASAGNRGFSLFLLAALLAGLAPPASGLEAITDLRVQNLDGRPYPLESLKGKVVVLDFWASWCIPCRTSFPFLDGLQQKHALQDLRVVGLTLEEDGDAVATFLAQVPVRFPILRDPSGRAGESFDVVAMPTTFLLDREGRVAARYEGSDARTHARLESAVETLLAGRPLPPGSDVRIGSGLEATGSLKAWQRGYLADPSMNLDGDSLMRLLNEHIHASKEAAAGDGGAAGGGCGCN